MAPDWNKIAAQFAHLVQNREWDRAEALLGGVAEHPTAPSAIHYNLAKVLIEKRKIGEAETWLERAAKANPDYPPTWFELGRCRLWARRPREASEAFRRAGELMPRDLDCRRLRGRAALAVGDWEGAAEAFRELRSLAPGDAEGLIKGFKAASEARLPEADALRAEIAARPDLRGQMINTIIRASRGRLPLQPGKVT